MEGLTEELHQKIRRKKRALEEKIRYFFHSPYMDSNGTLNAFLTRICESLLPILWMFLKTSFWAVGSCEEFRFQDVDEAFDVASPLWKDTILLTRTGLSLPDILCVGKHESGSRCLLSIQVKTWNEKPSPPSKDDPKGKERITAIVQNVSRPHFFTGHQSLQTSFYNRWKDCLSKIGNVYHLHVLVCWAGFTSIQIQLVDAFNEKHPSEPIVLAWPVDLNNNIYGYLPSVKLCEGVSKDPWKKKLRKMKMVNGHPEVFKQFEEFAKMDLEPEELLLDLLNLYE